MNSIVPRRLRLLAARKFIASVTAEAGPYYVWVGNQPDGSITKPVYDDVFDVSVEPYNGMVFGSAVTSNDVSLMVREIPYVANVVYTQYDDSDPEIFDKDFYVTVTSGDFIHTFKCLYNNGGAPSTAAPDIGDVDPGDIVYQTSDGYQWKYMYTIEDVDVLKFSSPGFVPIVANSSVTEAAVPGAIDVVAVTSAGMGYKNYLTGSFGIADVQVGGNGQIYSLTSNSTASGANGFYTGCIMYLSSGTGAGGYRTIVDYYSNSTGKYAVMSESFLTAPTNGTVWEISPEVVIVGSGTETNEAKARAVVNTVGNTIARVEVLDRGREYTTATANVVANSIVGVTSAATVRPIYGPPKGHGYDVAAELGATRASISVRLDGSVSNTVPATGDFTQHGLMTRPLFSQVTLGLSAYGGTASVGSTYLKVETLRVEGGATVSVGSNTITSNSGAFDQVFEIGDSVVVMEGITDRYLGSVTAVNSSTIEVAASLGWSSGNVEVYTAREVANAVIAEVESASSIVVSRVDGDIGVGDSIYVGNGGHWAVIDTVTRSGVAKGYSTFIQAQRVVGSYLSGELENNEVVYQGVSQNTATATAYVHSTEDVGGTVTVYLTGVFGTLETGTVLKGVSSGASLSVSYKYEAEIVPGSGEILYVENHDPVGRQPSQAEELNLLLSF